METTKTSPVAQPKTRTAVPTRKQRPITPATRVKWVAKLLLSVLLFVPVVLFMVWFNYSVDRSGLFQGSQYERDVAAMLLAGDNISGYEQMDERQISALLVQQMKQAPTTVALGSSRILQMDAETLGSKDFFNFGMVGADFYDVLGTFYLFVKEDKLPQNVVIGVDPWLFNENDDATDYRSDKELYTEFLAVELGEAVDYTPEDETEKWQALFSPSYFQGNWAYYRKDAQLRKMPVAVPDSELTTSETEIKCADGSVSYSIETRSATESDVSLTALTQAGTFLRCVNYITPSAERIRLFTKFVNYIKGKGVNVILVMVPYHPVMYEFAETYQDQLQGFLLTEDVVRDIGTQTNVPVYGTYNPHWVPAMHQTDFWDGIHCKNVGIARFWPGIDTVLQEQAAGKPGSDYLRSQAEYEAEVLAAQEAAQEAAENSAA